jgi:hypothetical protein
LINRTGINTSANIRAMPPPMPNAIRGTYTVSGIVPGLDGKQPKYRLGQRIGKSSWLGEYGVSLLRWRSGASNTPRYAPYPFMPSPTFAHSSRRVKRRWLIDEVILVRLARRCRYKNPRAATDPAARPFPLHAAGTGQCVTLPPSVTTPPEPWALRLINGRCLIELLTLEHVG